MDRDVPYDEAVNPYATPDGTGSDQLPYDFGSKPPSLARNMVEAMFYFTTVNSIFALYTGLGRMPFLGGGTILLAGTISMMIVLGSREKLPRILWFIFFFNLGANLSQGLAHGERPILGSKLAPVFHWFWHVAMMCYIVQNEAARKRMIFLLTVLVLVAVYWAGEALGTTRAETRLGLEKEFAGGLGDPNGLSYLSGLLAVALLFWSLRSSRLLRPVLWLAAALMVLTVFRTVSRSGILLTACGLSVLFVAILAGRGVRLSGIVLILMAVLGGMVVVSVAAESISYLGERFGEKSVRLAVYDWNLLEDLGASLIFGGGEIGGYTSAGINAHNTFIYAHMVFGGITSLPLLLMVLWLIRRVVRMLLIREIPLDRRLLVLASFGMVFGVLCFTNQGYVHLEAILALAMVDQLTAPYVAYREATQAGTSADPLVAEAYGALSRTQAYS